MTLFRLCSTKLCQNLNKINGLKASNGSHICKVNNELMRTQIATIIGLERQDPQVLANKPKPWPYKTKKYTWPHFWFGLDNTPERMDSNSKILVIEGNKASGKEVVAQELAKEFGMLYMPESDLSELYINHRGFDYRTLNHYLAERVQAVDEKLFYEKPHHKGVVWMKIIFYHQRYEQYVEALAHLFNTGQGVVLERSPYSDFVFTDAMHKCGFLPDDTRDYYYRMRHYSIYELMRPHLVIYLDVPVDECLNRIKKRNIPHEVNSKVLTKQYLQEIEDQYKNRYLPEASKASEVLIYDWSKYGDIEDVVEDIERLNMDDWDPHLEKFMDWNLWEQELWEMNRILYTNKKVEVCQKLTAPVYEVDSLSIEADEALHRDKIYRQMVPNYEIYPSFDPSMNSFWQILFRWRVPYKERIEFSLRHPFF